MKTKFLFRISLSIAFLLSITVSNWGQSVRNGRLVFASRAAYQQVFQQLTTQVNAYVEPAGEIQEGVEYDPYPTLAAFENSKPGFISLRKIALSDEYSQLRAGVDPDNLESKSLIFDPVAEAILNGNHVFQIADTIFYLPNSKRLIKILNANESVLQALMNNESVGNYQDKVIIEIQGGGLCEPEFNVSNSFLTSNSGSFTYNGTDPGPGTSYTWSFGDGTTSVQKNPSHTYASQGVYEVCLLIENDAQSCFNQICKTVIVNQGCVANFNYDESGTPGLVCFTDQSATINGTIISRSWSFGDGGISSEINPCHTYICDGKYTVTLTIKTSTNCTRIITRKVRVSSYHCCDSDIDASETVFAMFVGENRKIVGNCADNQWWFFSNVHANLWHYKKWGIWWPKKSDLKVEIRGSVYMEDEKGCSCEAPYDVSCSDAGYKSHVKAIKHDIPKAFKANKDNPWIANFYEGGVLRKTIVAPISCD